MTYETIAQDIKTDAQTLLNKDSLDVLAVRIESENDEVFWRPLIEKALPNKTLKFYAFFSETSPTKGRPDILKYAQFGDKQLIFCVDSDGSYLLEKTILQTPFLFHTYVDGIENFWCYAEGLPEVLKKVKNTEGSSFDFSDFFSRYSDIIYPYLVYSFYSSKEKNVPKHLSRKQLGIRAGFNSIEGFTVFQEKLQRFYADRLTPYQEDADFQTFEKRLNELGLAKENAYLFVRCHDILDRVVVPLLHHISDAHFAVLTTNEEKVNYKNHLESIVYSEIIRENSAFTDCLFYQWIVRDIQIAFQN